MKRLNSDTIIAILLLVASGVFLVASFDIREPDYGQLSPAAWPRAVIGLLALLSLIYLLQSIRQGAPPAEADDDNRPRTVAEFISYWRNVFWCFALFLAYLLALPVLGMLIGGVLFVFFLLNALGGWQLRLLALHALIAIVAIGGMWSLFTFGLGVILPPGEIIGRF